MIKFRQKNFSIFKDALTGAAIGGAISGSTSRFMFSKELVFDQEGKVVKDKNGNVITIDKKYNPLTIKFRKGSNGINIPINRSTVELGGLVIGAALGTIVGLVRNSVNKIQGKQTLDRRFMRKVIEMLKRDNFKENEDFTLDKKCASRLKTKVCIVVSRESSELNLVINTVSDKKLGDLTNSVVKNIPNSSVENTKVTDKFNEITVSSICDGAEPGLIAGIVEQFIHSGYPVFMVEVG